MLEYFFLCMRSSHDCSLTLFTFCVIHIEVYRSVLNLLGLLIQVPKSEEPLFGGFGALRLDEFRSVYRSVFLLGGGPSTSVDTPQVSLRDVPPSF